jgi:hypothetical protein
VRFQSDSRAAVCWRCRHECVLNGRRADADICCDSGRASTESAGEVCEAEPREEADGLLFDARTCESPHEMLNGLGISTLAIHDDGSQEKRTIAFNAFRGQTAGTLPGQAQSREHCWFSCRTSSDSFDISRRQRCRSMSCRSLEATIVKRDLVPGSFRTKSY